MQVECVLRSLAPRTRQHYIAAVKSLTAHYHKGPGALCQDDVQRYLLHLIEERKPAWSNTNQMACALRFFCHVTLARPTPIHHSYSTRAGQVAGKSFARASVTNPRCL